MGKVVVSFTVEAEVEVDGITGESNQREIWDQLREQFTIRELLDEALNQANMHVELSAVENNEDCPPDRAD